MYVCAYCFQTMNYNTFYARRALNVSDTGEEKENEYGK